MMRSLFAAVAAAIAFGSTGCATGILWAHKRPEIEAVSLNPADGPLYGKETGIPFYLPKPLLIVSKNFRNLEDPKTGLTDSPPIPTTFDDQSKFADVNARTNFTSPPASPGSSSTTQAGTLTGGASTAEKSGPTLFSSNGPPMSPGVVPSDGLKPDTFYTYQIVFVPDMTQKYGLKIHGGAGELRAAMNLVNGWQFTGIGPFYMKDSATAQNVIASGISARLGGQAAADVMHAAADLAKEAGKTQSGDLAANSAGVQRISKVMAGLPLGCAPMVIPNFAEVHVYEPSLTPDGRMNWCEIVHLSFDRNVIGHEVTELAWPPAKEKAGAPPAGGAGPAPGPTTQSGNLPNGAVATVDPSLARAAVAAVFGVSADSRALRTVRSTTQSGDLPSGNLTAPPGGTVNQINVGAGSPAKDCKLFPLCDPCCKPEAVRPMIQSRTISVPATVVNGQPGGSSFAAGAGTGGAGAAPAGGGILGIGTAKTTQSGTLPSGTGPSLPTPILNQTFNQYVSPANPANLGTPVPEKK